MISKKINLSEFVIEEIKQMLKRGELKEGDKLPNQNEFASQLGVSRISLREALHTLRLMGVVAQSPKVGTVILSGNPDLWVSQMPLPLLSDTNATMELLEARKFIEIGVSKLSIERITQDEILLLQDSINKMADAIDNNQPKEYVLLDIEFHKKIIEASRNRYLIHMFMTVLNLMEEFMKEAFEIMPGMLNDSIKLHKLILQSYVKRDKQKAVHYIKEHIKNIEKSMNKYYANRSTTP